MVLVPCVTAPLIAGCSTFSDNDAIARVGGTEMSSSELATYRELVGGTDENQADATITRSAISIWSEVQVLDQLLDRSGVDPDPAAVDAATQQAAAQVPGFTDLDDATRGQLVDYFTMIGLIPQSLPEFTPSDADIAEYFDRGPAESGLACVSHILVDTEQQANDIIDELDAGADFATLATERSTDTGSAENGGFLTCTSTDQIDSQFVPEFAAAADVALPGIPTGPVKTDFGYHVIRNGTFAEHPGELTPIVAQGYFSVRIAIDRADIHIDPRYGTNEGVAVVPFV